MNDFMANPKKEASPPKTNRPKVTNEAQEANMSRGLPLSAKDSEWIGMRTDFRSNDNTLPLFPGVKFSDNTESTTVITKLLVGQTPDFSRMPKPQRIFLNKHLSTVTEQSKEDFYQSDSDVSTIVRSDNGASESDVDYYDDEEDEPKRATHTKRRKKKSDVKELPVEVSSISLLPTVRRKSGSKIRHSEDSKNKFAQRNTSVFEKSSWNLSNDADDEYQTQSDETVPKSTSKKD